jgi:hypothetical protein
MDSSAAASPEAYRSAEEIAEDIEFQKILLLTLQDTSGKDRELGEAAIKAEIHRLEKELKTLRQGHHDAMASAAGTMSYSHDDDPFGPIITNSVLGEQPDNPLPLPTPLTP